MFQSPSEIRMRRAASFAQMRENGMLYVLIGALLLFGLLMMVRYLRIRKMTRVTACVLSIEERTVHGSHHGRHIVYDVKLAYTDDQGAEHTGACTLQKLPEDTAEVLVDPEKPEQLLPPDAAKGALTVACILLGVSLLGMVAAVL